MHRYFGFAIATVQIFQHPENVKISIFPLHCPSRNAISSEVFNEFSKPVFWLKDEDGGYCGWKFQVHRYFGFAIATLPLFQHPENVKISIFPFTLSQQKCYIFFKNFFWLKDKEGGYCGWKFQQKFWFSNRNVTSRRYPCISAFARIFWFCNNVTTFPTSRKCKNFNFSLYTVPAEMLYLQKYLTNFQKLSFDWKMRKVAIVVENFKCTDILVLQ